jgi:hypothetical protein
MERKHIQIGDQRGVVEIPLRCQTCGLMRLLINQTEPTIYRFCPKCGERILTWERGGLPFVSAICLTYNRPPAYQWLVEEAVESFIRQIFDYPAERMELIVLNDAAGQVLAWDDDLLVKVCNLNPVWVRDHIKLINVGTRYASLGEKYNVAIGMSEGELIMPFEDDDISLPHRIRQAVAMLGDDDYWRPPQVVYGPVDKGPIFEHNIGLRHHASIFRRSAWAKVGGYPPVSGAQDAAFDSLLRANCRVAMEEGWDASLEGGQWVGINTPGTWQYYYRWGIQPLHLSGRKPHDQFYAEIGRMPVEAGTFHLRPHWRQDYVRIVREALKS